MRLTGLPEVTFLAMCLVACLGRLDLPVLQPGKQLLKPGFGVSPASVLQGPSCFSGFQSWAVQLILRLSGRTEGYLSPPCLPPKPPVCVGDLKGVGG